MKASWKKRLTAIALVCLMVLAMVPEAAMSVYAAAPEDEFLVGAEEVIEQAADVPAEVVEEVPDISEEIPETVEGSEEATEEFIEEDAEEVIVEDAPVVIEEAVEPEIQSDVPVVLDEENEVVEPEVEANGVEAAQMADNDVEAALVEENDAKAEEIVGAASSATIVVKKEWSDGAANHTSDVVTASVMGGNTEETVTLNSDNSWQASVTGLDASTTYTVVENSVNNQDVTELYQDPIYTWGDPTSANEWVKTTMSSLKSGETYVFTYTSGGKTYALGDNSGSVGGYALANGTPASDISDNYRWTVTKSGNEWQLRNNGNNQYLYAFGFWYLIGATYALEFSSDPTSVTINSSNEIGHQGTAIWFPIRVSGSTASMNSGSAASFTPYLLKSVTTTTVCTITNTPREKFYVYHTGAPASDTNPETVYIDGTYDLTQNLTSDTLYGGYYLEGGITTKVTTAAYDGTNWTFTTAETTSGTAITPTAGETYYVKEVPTTYLKPTTYILYDTSEKVEDNSACKGLVRRLFAMTAVDDERYQSVGFDIGGMENAPSYENSSIYTDFTVYKSGNVYKQYDAKKIFGVPGGNLAVANTTDGLLKEDNSYTMTPYWITMDGIKVTSAYVYSQSIGDGYHYGWVAPGITKDMESATSTLTVQAQTVTAKKLAVSRFVFNDDETTPTETVTPTEAAEPTAEPTEEAEPTETVEPTEAPTEEAEPTETVEPEDSSTEDPASTETPTTTPMSPSNNSGSGALANLLRLLRSIFS